MFEFSTIVLTLYRISWNIVEYQQITIFIDNVLRNLNIDFRTHSNCST